MKKTKFFFLIFLGVFSSCNSNHEKKNTEATKEIVEEKPINLIERGEYLVDLGGCHHCHSPKIMSEKGPIPDPDRLLSGHPAGEALPPFDEETAKGYVLFSMGFTSFTGPWGTTFAANLTPDDSGIGTWSETQFFKSIREGKHKGLDDSRIVLPPMPWEDFAKMSDEDLKSIFSYLKSLAPVENIVPPPVPPSM